MTNFDIKYRVKTPDMIPSATHIDGEPVWAEITSNGEDLTLVYVTKKDDTHWHVWIAYASDDPAATEFHEVFAYGGHTQGETGPEDYPMYVKAVEEAATLAE